LRIHGVPICWQSKIEDWEPNRRFVDTQTRGPYKRWQHTHTFLSVSGGTLMVDTIRYSVPGGCVGKYLLLGPVRQDISKIFNYRSEKIHERFPASH
jgi:ligand-binding SRPBCC domain-containing protein